MTNQTRCALVAAQSVLLTGIAGTLLAGCGSSTSSDTISTTPQISVKALSPEQSKTRAQLAQKGFGSDEVNYTFDLLQKVSAQTPSANVFLSPFSASQAILLAANGTTGATQKAFLKAVGLSGADIQTANVEKKELLAMLEPPAIKGIDDKESPAYEWTLANAIWSKYPPKPEYVSRIASDLRATAEPLTDAATINTWVKDKTRGRIDQIVTEQAVRNSDLILTNAVYFKGSWVAPFETRSTRDAPFHLPDNTTRQQPLMHRTARNIPWFAGKNYEAVSLPYKGNTSMIVVLPASGTAPQKMVTALSATEWSALRKGLKPTWVELALPKFELNYDTSLLKPLKELGMPTSGNFTPVADQLAQAGISDVIQKTFLRVDEKGTEAAAATAVVVTTAAPLPSQGKPHPFIVDRPFLCMIVHDNTGTILFAGVINDPKPPKS